MPAWLAALMTRKMLICIFTGFSSGLPLYLLLNLLPAWLRSEGVDLKTIGFFALIQFPYTWKFLWSPLLDRFSVPGFGRRRGWMLITQVGLLFVIGALGGFSPKDNIWPILWLATLLSLLSATQDIAVDRIPRANFLGEELGIGNAVHVNAYRIAGLVPGSLSLILADRLPWNEVFWITGAFMLPGMAMAWLVSEPKVVGAPKTLRQAVSEPFHEFVGRQGWRGALLVLAGGVIGQFAGGGIGLAVTGLLIILSVLAERRYHRTASPEAPSGPEWTNTGEIFADDERGGWVSVWYNRQTGERRYLPADLPPARIP